jgi:DNA repair exonuclease SbcCD ATPase subunit
MRLTRLKVENFGRHKAIDKEIDVPVLGLMGPNGSGKSTLLSAVKFLFTNELEDKNETYVRNTFSEEQGTPSFAKVTGWFRKDGKEGEIMRQIGSTTKRHLKWDGEIYTSAADVEDKLKEIFEADKEARSNAIFPPQGSLDKLIFGTPAERMELFSKLLLVGYMGKISTLCEKQSAILGTMVRDYTSLHTEVKAQHAAAEDTYAQLENQKNQSYNWKADKEAFERYAQIQNAAVSIISQKKNIDISVQDKILSAKKITKDISLALGGSDDAPELTFEEIEAKVTDIKQQINSATIDVSEYKRIAEISRNIQHLKEREDSILKDLSDIPEGINTADIQKDIAALRQDLATMELHEKMQGELHMFHMPMLAKIKEALASGVIDFAVGVPEIDQVLSGNPKLPDAPSEAQMQVYLDFEAAANQEVVALKGQATALQIIVNIDDQNTGSCPVCGQCTSGHTEDWSEKLDLTNRMLITAHSKHRAAAQALQVMQGNIQLRESAIARLNVMLVDRQEEVIKIQQASSPVDLQAMEAMRLRMALLVDQEREQYQLHQKQQMLVEELSRIQSALKNIPVSDAEIAESLSPGTLQVTELKLEELLSTYKKVNLGRDDTYFLDTISSIHLDVSKIEAQSQQLQDIYLQHVNDAKVESGNFTPQLNDLLSEQSNDASSVIEILTQNTNAFNELTGAVRQAKEHADQLQIRRNEIELQIDRDQQRQLLIAEMRSLKDVFGKKGIPQTYVQYIYENLLPVAQENLNMLGADFVIAVDPDEPVTLRFMKLNSDVSGWMPQSKLSGGQKVRVSIAFLLAVQQLIIPDIAFLVLDEPSTHIDDEGIEAMKELFLNLGEQLQNTEAQVIVCDHKSELHAAFHETINLA